MKDNKRNKIYVVQLIDDVTNIELFGERTVVCDIMSEITGVEWKKSILDYNFSTMKRKQFKYNGYNVFLRNKHKGPSRGRYYNVEVKKK